jgi:hypothetical protein
MAIVPVQPPTNDPPLRGMTQFFSQAWSAFFQDVSDQAAVVAALTALAAGPSYANDAAAATGGVPVAGLYRNGSAIQIRVT